MKDKELKELIDKGHILCRAIFEMAGNPKDHVEKTLREYIQKIKEDPDYIFTKEFLSPAEENEGIWSLFYESEIVVASLEKLNVLCFNLGPASIEIIQPENITLSDKRLTEVYTDFASKLHEVGIALKSVASENDLLKANLSRAIRNCVVLALNEPKTASEIAEKVGIDTGHIQPFLEVLIKEKSLVKDGEKYHKKN
jgi:hypothetical protein